MIPDDDSGVGGIDEAQAAGWGDPDAPGAATWGRA